MDGDERRNLISVSSGSSGSGNGTVTYTVAANSGSDSRTGAVTVAGQVFTVTQSGTSCGYSISPTGTGFSTSGGVANIAVTTGSACAWTATSNATWISDHVGAAGTGNGTVGIAVAANTGGQRTGTVTVAGQLHRHPGGSVVQLLHPPNQCLLLQRRRYR